LIDFNQASKITQQASVEISILQLRLGHHRERLLELRKMEYRTQESREDEEKLENIIDVLIERINEL